jgi:hypothetical protein
MADLQAEYRLVLKTEYEKRVSKNPRYSQTAFARSLGLNATYFSKLNSGTILLSLPLAESITEKLKLSPKARASFLCSVADEHRCHSLYRIDPSLTDCSPEKHVTNSAPKFRRKQDP